MVRVYRALDEVEAELLRGRLEQHGITAILEGGAVSGLLGAPTPALHRVLTVADEHAAGTQRLPVEWDALRPNRMCQGCGYDLRGLPAPRSPECGRPLVPPAEAREPAGP